MPVYSISYDLKDSKQDIYDELEDRITSNSSDSVKYAETSWIVKSNHSCASDLCSAIIPSPKKGDRILVIKVDNDKQGWLTESQWAKINSMF